MRSDEGLVEIRRSGDEAVLMFRWRPYPYLFGVPISLTKTDRRLDWDQPAADLDEWVDSIDLWRMETLENGWTLQARRRQVGLAAYAWCCAKTTQIYEGTNHVQRIVMARQLLAGVQSHI
jgi:hypothetical protein